jgi:hypothetical protein
VNASRALEEVRRRQTAPAPEPKSAKKTGPTVTITVGPPEAQAIRSRIAAFNVSLRTDTGWSVTTLTVVRGEERFALDLG